MENQSEENEYRLPGDEDIERASLEAARRAISEVAGIQREAKKGRRLAFMPALKIAAMVALVSSLSFYFYQRSKNTAPRNITVVAQPGERKRITLPDGSVAELNAASAVTYPAEFGENREVSLSGEAFFKITRDPSHPFIVRAGNLDVKVLGTSFNVKAYKSDASSQVTVATGKVSVNNTGQDQRVMLLPGDQLTFHHATSAFTKIKVAPGQAAEWQSQVLNFEFRTLREIGTELERVYGVQIEIRNKELAGEKFRLRVSNESLSNILKLLSISGGGFSYRIDGKQVTIE